MKKIESKKLYYWGLFLVLIVNITIHNAWFFTLSPISYGDTWYAMPETTIERWFPSLWSNDSGLGKVNPMPNYAIVSFAVGICGSCLSKIFGILYLSEILQRLFFYFPFVILGSIGSYILIYKITKNVKGSIVGAFVFNFNTLLLIPTATGHMLLAIAYTLFPFAFYYALKISKSARIKDGLIFVLILVLSAIYDARVTYVMLIIFFLFFLYNYVISFSFIKFQYFFKFLLPLLVIFLLLNIYWLLPLPNIATGLTGISIGRDIFRGPDLSESLLLTNFALFHPWWSGGKLVPFLNFNIPAFFFLFPFVAFLALFFGKNNMNRETRSYLLFFSALAILGITLSKFYFSPFPNLYEWLYANIPGFSAFREPSKFLFLIYTSYGILIAIYISTSFSNVYLRFLKRIFSCSILFVLLVTVFPVWNSSIDGTFAKRSVPNEYYTLREFLLGNNDYFRTLWIPQASRWGLATTIHPVSSYSDIENDLLFQHRSNLLNISNSDDFSSFLSSGEFASIINISAIKFLIVPIRDIDNNDDFFSNYENNEGIDIRDWYIDELNKIPWLKKVNIGTKDLAVYENQNYNPYIFASNEMNGLESFDDIDDKYNYLTNEVRSDFVFYDLDKSKLPSRKLYVPFELITSSSIVNAKVNSTIADSNDVSNVYINTAKKSVVIRHVANKLEISKELKNNISFNGDLTNLDSAPEILYASKAGSTNYYAEIGSRLINIAAEKKETNLGVVTEPFELFALSKNNAIKNASFESGKWSENVGDCNAHDSKSIVSMETSNNASEGETSIQLDATSHIACTNQSDVSVNSGQSYLFGFDYQSSNAKNAGYYIQFNDTLNSVIGERLPVDNVNWNTFQKKIIVPEGATNMNLFIYSYSSDNKTTITTKYDNFKLFALEKVTTIDPKYAPRFEKINIPAKNEYKIEYSDPNENFNNLIKNPSLEDGLWSEQVGDCNNYDSNGQLSMSQSTEQKTNGNYSLQLGATRHIACTGAGLIPVTENRTYLFSFDYQSPNGKEAGYYLSFNDPEKTVISERLPIKDAEWHNFTKQIKAPAGASAVSLIVYAYADNGDKEIINRYDNFSFIGLPDLEDRYFFVTEPKEKLNNPASVEFELINPTKKKVHIKGATTAFYLSMSESYHPQWQAQMNNQKIQGFFSRWVPWAKPDRIEDDKHFELEGFLNGWYVDTEKLCANNSACTKNPDGSYDMEMVIEFFPQRWFYLGLLISGMTLLGCIGYLGYDWRRRRKKKVISLAAYQEREAEA